MCWSMSMRLGLVPKMIKGDYDIDYRGLGFWLGQKHAAQSEPSLAADDVAQTVFIGVEANRFVNLLLPLVQTYVLGRAKRLRVGRRGADASLQGDRNVWRGHCAALYKLG